MFENYYLPHQKILIEWVKENTFSLRLPWTTLNIEVENKDKGWIEKAIHSLHGDPGHPLVQRFLDQLSFYPISYQKPRKGEGFVAPFYEKFSGALEAMDFSSPLTFLHSLKIQLEPVLQKDLPLSWEWNEEEVLEKSKIAGTDLYDPISFISYLHLYRYEWEKSKWTGQNGLSQFLEKMVHENEERFFKLIGWISRQSHYVTKNFCKACDNAVKNFTVIAPLLSEYLKEEIGHHKFMEQVISDLGFKSVDEFEVGEATRFLIKVPEILGNLSPLAFCAVINIFEVICYDEIDPISKIVKKSSKPYAAKGYNLHFKINMEHDHAGVPMRLAKLLPPQEKKHLLITMRIYELTLILLEKMEQKLPTFYLLNP